jgi:regulator of protease activity HflC (stomatin/prohibitin superfamily)
MFKESAKLLVWLIPVLLLALMVLPQAIRILREYERGVIFRLGKLLGTEGPGMIFLIPVVDRMVKMHLRVVTIDVARQEVMTSDNVPMTVDAVVYFRVVRPRGCGRASGELPEGDFAHFANNVAQRARTG